MLHSAGTRVRVRAVVLNVGGNPKPEVVPPGSKLRASLFLGARLTSAACACAAACVRKCSCGAVPPIC
jgi:hypothetical protein